MTEDKHTAFEVVAVVLLQRGLADLESGGLLCRCCGGFFVRRSAGMSSV